MDLIKIAPADNEECAKAFQELKCPFCGSHFETAELDATERKVKSKCTPDDERNCYIRETKESIPIVIKCSKCGIQIRNLLFLGWYTRCDNYKSTLEQREIDEWKPKK